MNPPRVHDMQDLDVRHNNMGTAKYNLEQLGWFNFEQLVRTLLRQVVGAGISSFSGSVDQGRDATFSGRSALYPSSTDQWQGDWIFQVKHRTYSTRGADSVRAELKRNLPAEVARTLEKRSHECNVYMALTNCPLTAQDKDDIHALIQAHATDVAHIAVLGESDIQELLDCHPRVVSAFPQLLGVSQLRELVEWGLHQRSLEYLLAAQAEIATFVATTPYLGALDVLHRQHFCVLSGPPKMGKTCTAYALAASFAAQSYDVYDLRNQRDFYDAYRADVSQLFICDDVFGDIALQATQRDDWTRGFLRLLGSLGREHKLIWTAREYILREALASSRLQEERPVLMEGDTVTIAVDRLTRMERAMILYNHARAANLPADVRSYLRGKACVTITDHPNFSPESVRQLCTGRLVSFSESSNGDEAIMALRVREFLSSPGEAWKAAYRAAPIGEQLLCTEVMAAGGSIAVSELRSRYENAASSAVESHQSFETSLGGAQGTFLRLRPPMLGIGDESVQFYHPSMRDLLHELIQTDRKTRVAYLKQLTMKELPAIASLPDDARASGSDEHRIVISETGDTELLKDHVRETLLPTATLPDALSVITFLHRALEQRRGARSVVRHVDARAGAFWVIHDLVVPYVCSRQFWAANAGYAYVPHWRRLVQCLRQLLPMASVATTPEYIPELLRRLRDDSSVDYWGLVVAAHALIPTVVEQCIDMGEREGCRARLRALVDQAISEAESLDLADDYDASQSWHDEFGELPEKCRDYDDLFPDDEVIDSVSELEGIIEMCPRIEEKPDEDYDPDSIRPFSSSSSDDDITEMFSDL